MVSPETKDMVLRKLVEDFEVGSLIQLDVLNDSFGIDRGLFIAIIEQLKYYNFFEIYHVSECRDVFLISLNLHAHDFLRRGGFTGDEILFKDNIEKLYNELEKIQKENSEDLSAKTKSNIGNTIQVIAALFEIKNSILSQS